MKPWEMNWGEEAPPAKEGSDLKPWEQEWDTPELDSWQISNLGSNTFDGRNALETLNVTADKYGTMQDEFGFEVPVYSDPYLVRANQGVSDVPSYNDPYLARVQQGLPQQQVQAPQEDGWMTRNIFKPAAEGVMQGVNQLEQFTADVAQDASDALGDLGYLGYDENGNFGYHRVTPQDLQRPTDVNDEYVKNISTEEGIIPSVVEGLSQFGTGMLAAPARAGMLARSAISAGAAHDPRNATLSDYIVPGVDAQFREENPMTARGVNVVEDLTLGRAVEGAVDAVKYGISKVASKFDAPDLVQLESMGNQYRNLAKAPGGINKDNLNTKLKNADGTESDITVRDFQETVEKFDLINRLNQEGASTGVNTVQKMLGSKTILEKMGIVPSNTEQLYMKINSEAGHGALQWLGIRESGIDKKRVEAIKASQDDIAERFEVISKGNDFFKGTLDELTSAIRYTEDALKVGDNFGFKKSSEITDNLEKTLRADKEGVIKELEDNGASFKTIAKTKEQFDAMFSIIRDVKAMRKLGEATGKGKDSLIGKALSLTTLGGVTALLSTGPIGAAVAGGAALGRKALSQQTTKNIGDSVANYSRLLKGEKETGVPTAYAGYHGSKDPNFIPNPEQDLWMFDNPTAANRYVRQTGTVYNDTGILNNPEVYNAEGMPINRFQAKALEGLKAKGKDGLILNNVRAPDGSLQNVIIKFGKNGEPIVVPTTSKYALPAQAYSEETDMRKPWERY